MSEQQIVEDHNFVVFIERIYADMRLERMRTINLMRGPFNGTPEFVDLQETTMIREERLSHPDYPLFGLEYEVQFVLGNHPGCQVYMAVGSYCSMDTVKIPQVIKWSDAYKAYPTQAGVWLSQFMPGTIEDYDKAVLIVLPEKLKRRLDAATFNFEFKTPPVGPHQLKKALLKIDRQIGSIVKYLATHLHQPVAALLPVSPQRKHVSCTWPEMPTYPLEGEWKEDAIYSHARSHTKVPYDWTDYELVLKHAKRGCTDYYTFCHGYVMDKPIRLGYSMAGNHYVKVNGVT